MESLVRTNVRGAHLTLDFEEDIQLPGLVLLCVFIAGLLNGFREVMIIRDGVALLMRTQNLRDFAFELVGILFYGRVDDFP